ncbi:MAG: MFS transporter [Candidatus Moraniibacteriota bacterium]|nr:MAG: MFS transporter [Candidatus Moranbacteria bacterium]
MSEATESSLRHSEQYDSLQTRRLSGIAFLFGFADSFLVYILSAYFSESIGSANVSAFYFIAFGIMLAFLFSLQAVVRSIGETSLFMLFILGVIGVQIPLTFLPTSISGSMLIMGYLVATALAWVTLDMVLERSSEDRRSGRIRGMNLSAMNLGILFAPFLSATILGHFGFSGVFFVSLIFYSILFLLALLLLASSKRPIERQVSPVNIFRKVRRRTDIARIYIVSFALNFFYATMIVYTSLRLRELGMSWNHIGIVFTIMLIPFVIIQYPLGNIADRRTGEKELLIGSLILSALSTASLVWIESPSVVLWATLLFITRVGIAGVEVLSDSYFYKRIDGSDNDLIAFFRTARPVGNIIAALFLGTWLIFFPLSSIFILPAIILLVALIPAISLQDNPSEREQDSILHGNQPIEARINSYGTGTF